MKRILFAVALVLAGMAAGIVSVIYSASIGFDGQFYTLDYLGHEFIYTGEENHHE